MSSIEKSATSEPRIGLFAGSFNPFTVGHASVVERALPLFDKIYIAVGVNPEKTADGKLQHIEAIRKYADRVDASRISVVQYADELTVELAHRLGARWLIRGVRSVKDFEYEREMADINRRIGGIETVILFTLPEHSSISSSIVRELSSYGKDVSAFLP